LYDRTITQDLSVLRVNSTPVQSIQEALEIIPKLEKALNNSQGVGLAAIQLGIPKTIAILKNNTSFVRLINPEIIEKEECFTNHNESCLSLPNIFRDTTRYKEFVIKNKIIDEDKFREETWYFSYDNSPLETIACQHELDHFAGILITDHTVVLCPPTNTPKIGRNESCFCGSGKKFKRCCGR